MATTVALLQGEILDEAHEFVENLADIFDYVTPCFPEKYRIFKVIFKEYHQHLSYMLDCMGACAEQLANSDILKVCHSSPCHLAMTSWHGPSHHLLEWIFLFSQAGLHDEMLRVQGKMDAKAALPVSDASEGSVYSGPREMTPSAVSTASVVRLDVHVILLLLGALHVHDRGRSGHAGDPLDEQLPGDTEGAGAGGR